MGYSKTELSSLCSASVENTFVGKHSGPCIVAGTGRCVWQDSYGLDMGLPVITVNDMVMYWPGRVSHAYSHDEKQLVHWVEGRRRWLQTAYGRPQALHTCEPCRVSGVTSWPFPTMGGSGVAACHLALALGFDEVIAVGLPMDNSGHFYDPPDSMHKDRKWSNFVNETPDRIILNAKEFYSGRVTPKSGRFRELLS